MKKSTIIIITTFILLMLIRLLGITYGYYGVRINENQSEKSFAADTKYLSVIYADGTAKMNFIGDYFFPGDSAEKTFTVTNDGTADATYNIIIDNVVNEFERIQDLRYDLYINDELIVEDGAINYNETQYLYFDRSLTKGATDNVKFIFTYAETEEVQNMDMNKNISFRFNINSDLKNTAESTTNNVSILSNSKYLNSYRIYGNSIQNGTPTPTTPVKIESVGEKTKNLLKTNKTEATSSNGEVSVTNDNGKVHVFGTATTKANVDRIFVIENPQELIGKTLITKTKSGTDQVFIYAHLYAESGTTWNWISQYTGTYSNVVPEDVTKIEVGVSWIEGAIDTTIYPQIEAGDVATDYEPYGKYKIPITVSGKNILDVNQELQPFVINGTTRYGFNLPRGISTITISTSLKEDKSNITSGMHIYEVGADNSFTSISSYSPNTTSNKKVILDSLKNYILVCVSTSNKSLAQEVIDTYYWQIEEGEEATEYEPYIEPQTYNIFLDEPLRGIGNYKDYIDFKNQKIVRNIKEVDMSTLSWAYNTDYNVFANRINDGITFSSLGTNASHCTHYPLYVGSHGLMPDKSFQNPSNYWALYNYAVVKDTDYTDLTSFKNYLEGNEVLLDYILATPSEKPIKLPTIDLHEGTNKISVGTSIVPSNIYVEDKR